MPKMQCWDVYSGTTWLDSVFFDYATSAEEVKKSLIEHDGYPPNIEVKQEIIRGER